MAGRRHGVLITSGSIAATVVGAGSTMGAVATAMGRIGSILFLAAQFYAMGALISQLMALPLRLAIILSGVVLIVYTLPLAFVTTLIVCLLGAKD